MGRLQAESSHDHLQVSEDHSLGLEPVTIPVHNLQNYFFCTILEFLANVLEVLFIY